MLQFTAEVFIFSTVHSQTSHLLFRASSPPEVSQGHDDSLAVEGPTAAQLSTASHRNGAGIAQFPPTQNGASRGSSHSQVHVKLAYFNVINSSDIKDAPHMAVA